jgi:hypothetical protein
MNIIRIALIVGFAFWLVGTAILVPSGHQLFGPDNRLPAALWSALIVVATFYGVYRIARRAFMNGAAVTLGDGALFGAFACLPGLVLDAAAYAFGRGLYPGLDAAASGIMTITLLLAYASALLATLYAARRASTSSVEQTATYSA